MARPRSRFPGPVFIVRLVYSESPVKWQVFLERTGPEKRVRVGEGGKACERDPGTRALRLNYPGQRLTDGNGFFPSAYPDVVRALQDLLDLQISTAQLSFSHFQSEASI